MWGTFKTIQHLTALIFCLSRNFINISLSFLCRGRWPNHNMVRYEWSVRYVIQLVRHKVMFYSEVSLPKISWHLNLQMDRILWVFSNVVLDTLALEKDKSLYNCRSTKHKLVEYEDIHDITILVNTCLPTIPLPLLASYLDLDWSHNHSGLNEWMNIYLKSKMHFSWTSLVKSPNAASFMTCQKLWMSMIR